MIRFDQPNIGEIREADHGKWFSYRETKDPWALERGLPHELDVLDGVRFAKVLKTVAHVCCDEAADGSPKLAAWKIKKHIVYVRAPGCAAG